MTFAQYRQIFRNRAYRRFWLGFTFSELGDTMTRVALTWFVYAATHSAVALSWLMFCYTAPIVIGGLLAGPLLDRFDRRRVIMVDNTFRGVAVASIPILYSLGMFALWHIYVVASIYGLLMMISLAGGPALIPDLVDADQLATANALEMLSFTLGGVVGPPIAGLLIPLLRAPNLLIVDAISYFTFALALASIRGLSAPYPSADERRSSYRLSDAIRLLFKHPVLLATTLMFMAYNIGGGLLNVWLPILSDQVLGGGSRLYGTLLGAIAAGEVLSTVLVGGLTLRFSLGTRICMTQVLAGFAVGLIVIGPTLWATLLALALFGAFSAPLTIWAQTLRMQIIPERLRGRAFALLRMLMQSGNPVGGVLAGPLIPVAGLSATIGVSALLVGLPGIIGASIRSLRHAGIAPALPDNSYAELGAAFVPEER